MSSTGTRPLRTVQSRSNEALIEADKELINSLKIFSEASNFVAGLTGTPAQNSPKTPAGNYIAREGDSMIGPLALGPPLDFRIEVDANNTIDIGPLSDNAQFASNVQLDDLQPNSSVLDIIANAAFDGQILVLRTFAPTAQYTISQGTLANGGNIQTGDGNNLTVGDLQTVTLIFDESLKIEANIGGSWRIISVSSGTGGLTEPVILTINTITPQTLPTTSVIDWSKNPNQITLDRAVQFSFSNLPASGSYEGVLVIIDIDATGGFATPLWPGSLTNPPIVPTTALTRTSVMLYTIDGGTVVTHATSVGSSSSGGSVSQWATFPAVTNIDADDNDIVKVKNIDFDDALSTIFGLVDLQWFQGGHQFTSVTGALNYRVDTSDDHNFFTGANQILQINNTFGLDMLDNPIKDAKHISFDAAATLAISGAVPSIGFDSAGSELTYNAPAGAGHTWSFNLVDSMFLTTNNLAFKDGFQVIFNPNTTNPGVNIGLVVGDPSATNNGDLWYNATTNKFRTKENGVNVDVVGGTAGANQSLSNLTSPTSVNQDLIPDQATGGNLGSATATEEWFNLFSRRVTFPVATSIGAGDYSFGRVTTPDRVQYNVPTGAVHRWTINGSNEMQLSSVELILNGVNLDMENNTITDASQVQLTGSSGDVIRGFLSGSAGIFDITANENNSKVRIFARNNAGTLLNLIEADGQSGLVTFGQSALSFGSTTNPPTITRSGDDLNIAVVTAAQINLDIGATSVINITSADINIAKDLDMANNITVDWATTQSTVGAAGGASSLPATPTGYIIIKVNGTERVIPFYAKV